MLARYQNVFRSRWKALWWAGGVLVTAYFAVPSPEEAAQEPPPEAPAHHVNPWALDKGNAQG